jgi:hypothetical protein
MTIKEYWERMRMTNEEYQNISGNAVTNTDEVEVLITRLLQFIHGESSIMQFQQTLIDTVAMLRLLRQREAAWELRFMNLLKDENKKLVDAQTEIAQLRNDYCRFVNYEYSKE